ncbi:MAG: hypothetical protein IT307_18695 [Chloroflexi bacterium]|nr:hypothetical protein [Chloroflexota bacterium]
MVGESDSNPKAVAIWSAGRPLPREACAVRVEAEIPDVLERDAVVDVCCTIENVGSAIFATRPPHAVQISYKWLDPIDGHQIEIEELRSPLPRPVPPRFPISCSFRLRTPPAQGSYTVLVTLVQDPATWFDVIDPANGCTRSVRLVGRDQAPTRTITDLAPTTNGTLAVLSDEIARMAQIAEELRDLLGAERARLAQRDEEILSAVRSLQESVAAWLAQSAAETRPALQASAPAQDTPTRPIDPSEQCETPGTGESAPVVANVAPSSSTADADPPATTPRAESYPLVADDEETPQPLRPFTMSSFPRPVPFDDAIDEAGGDDETGPGVPDPDLQAVEDVRQVVRTTLPPNATVIVVSRGDDRLLELDGRRGWHFPQWPGGGYADDFESGAAPAIAHLEELRDRGGEFFLIPSPSFWVMEHEAYHDFVQHLDSRYERTWSDRRCVIYHLVERNAVEQTPTPSGWWRRLVQWLVS